MPRNARTALVSGGNRGIGFEVCRQLGQAGLSVILGARDPALGATAAAALRGDGLDVRAEQLDVADEASVAACVARLAADGVRVGVLVNNAGIYPQGTLTELDTATMRDCLGTNLLGAWWLARALLPAMVRARYGRIVNVSSGYGSFAAGLGGPPAYAISKAALNALTVKLAQEAGPHVKVNAADPGWVQTRMGGEDADTPVPAAADGIVWLATLPADGPSGGFFHQRRRIGW